MKIKEITTLKTKNTLTPQKARIKSLQNQKDSISKQLKAERDRQKRQRAMDILKKTY